MGPAEASAALVFRKDCAKHPLLNRRALTLVEKACNTMRFVVVEHRNFSPASPAPEKFLSRAPQRAGNVQKDPVV
jgi:hypothetical protein